MNNKRKVNQLRVASCVAVRIFRKLSEDEPDFGYKEKMYFDEAIEEAVVRIYGQLHPRRIRNLSILIKEKITTECEEVIVQFSQEHPKEIFDEGIV